MGKLPIVNNPKEDLKLKIENNVKEILKIQVEALELKSINDQKIYKQKIDLLDKQIDNLVYKLYDLTGEEIKIVEES